MTSCPPAAIRIDDPPRQGRDTRNSAKLSAAAELALIHRWHNRHDLAAAHLLVTASLRSAARTAEILARRYGVACDELLAEAYVGLMSSLCRFDPRAAEPFSDYAAAHMSSAMQAFIRGSRSLEPLAGSLEDDSLRADEKVTAGPENERPLPLERGSKLRVLADRTETSNSRRYHGRGVRDHVRAHAIGQ